MLKAMKQNGEGAYIEFRSGRARDRALAWVASAFLKPSRSKAVLL